jgi:hypothetical protein
MLRQQYALSVALAFFVIGVVGCSKSSPKSTLEVMCAAHKNKDVETYKSTLSANTLKEFEKEANEAHHSVNELIEGFFTLEPCPTPLETRGESIDGDIGVIEMKTKYNSWDKVSFIKEHGQWKYDLKKN